MILHPIIDLLKRIVVDLPEYVQPSGGGEDLLEKRITNTLTEYRNTKTLTLAQYAFAAATALKNLFIPNGIIGSNALLNCTGLLTIVVRQLEGWACGNCNKMLTVDLLGSTRMGQQCFATCKSLASLILRSTSVTPVQNVNVFISTPFASGGTGGTIYIPKALYDHLGDGSALDYKSATNWSTIDGYGTITWAQIEGSTYETHYADGTVIS